MSFIIAYLTLIFYIIEGYVLWGWDEITGKASKRSVYRMPICNECEHNHSGICKLCGCILKAKTRVNFPLDENGKSIGGCPVLKW